LSKKLYIGIAAGILIGVSIPVLIKFKREEEMFSGEDLSDGNELLNKANQDLMSARKIVKEMIAEAEEKSNEILAEAGKILSLAKNKTPSIHF
jgi:hypothetical protein